MFDKKIIVDIDISNCQIRAFKPQIQTFCKNDDISKILFWNTYEPDRLNKRQLGSLRGDALKEAAKIIDKYGSINTIGFYDSLKIDKKDFILTEVSK